MQSDFAPEGLFDLLQGPAFARLSQTPVERGHKLITAGSPAEAMYLVFSGRFRVERDGVDLAEIGAGSVIGEIAFLTGSTRTADVVAARDSIVYRIDRPAYDALCAEVDGLPQAMAAELADRLAKTSARVIPDPGRPPARTFCILPAANAPLPERFVPDLRAAMEAHHSVALVTEAAFIEAMGARADPTSPASIAWLNAQEQNAQTVLFVANPDASDWSKAALKQADQAVIVAQAVHYQDPSELEAFALQILPESQRRLVLLHPHRMQKAPGTGRWLDTRPVFLHHHVALTGDGGDIARLGRFLAGRAVGLVLSGGGAFGVAHVGVYRAMNELGLPVDIVGGTSVGSAMGGAIALGVPAEEIGPRVEQIFVRSGAMRKITVPKFAFLDHKVLDAALQEHFGEEPIEDLWMPYYAVAADLSAMDKTVITRGPLWEAIRASSAIPGVLPPFFARNGRMLVDGGCIDNMPFRTMHGMKSGPNVVVNVQKATNKIVHVDYASLPGRGQLLRQTLNPFAKTPPRVPGVISTVMRSLLVGQSDMLSNLAPNDLMIRPPGLKGAGFLAWGQHKLFYEMAYKHALEVFTAQDSDSAEAMAALRTAAQTQA
ncbi:patatin-like phospholipase family protein [Rhodobacteraceae bacterium N5(2021)]|uniref:Patatin-like phospholipase family protein n=1 Tax=Gymnodinialimonas phycosphaerae TaxID=2841589 RepID=A0A975YFM7_9RHOB|nr:patatin-like phospholipase family protein [Gymnodinialimonas phycosphaerae]MBY4894965.1 patatin-like phospholipase family protein [Gymnodinialimonas phycosphaerae]